MKEGKKERRESDTRTNGKNKEGRNERERLAEADRYYDYWKEHKDRI